VTGGLDSRYRIRLAGVADAGLLAEHRVAMFRDMGRTVPAVEPSLRDSCADHFARALESGEYVSWIAELAAPPHTPVAGAGVQLRAMLPRTDPSGEVLLIGKEGLVLNVYVEPEHRRRGIARRLMEILIDWAPGAGIVRLVLHAAPDGRPLYESLGFRASNEMLFPPFLPASPDGSASRAHRPL
jgi:GNAT superfamily N-acetyltransferase